jgi:Uma2 family endonuclease
MSATWSVNGPGPITVHTRPLVKDFTDDEFFEFCQLNKDLRIERTAEGDLTIMPPTGGETGIRNFKLIVSVGEWVKNDGTGQAFDSSTAFRLPNGATRSPDLSWVRNERWNALSKEQKRKFPPLCPAFVVELLSESDSLSDLQDKMQEYVDNGAELGWLFDPFAHRVYIYQPHKPVGILDDPQTVSGEPLLKGFVLDVHPLWD